MMADMNSTAKKRSISKASFLMKPEKRLRIFSDECCIFLENEISSKKGNRKVNEGIG